MPNNPREPDAITRNLVQTEGPGRTPEDVQQEAAVWVQNTWSGGDAVCPMCHNIEWGVGFPVYFHAVGRPDGKHNAVVPAVPVTCTNCGNTQFLSLVAVGIDWKPTADEFWRLG
jgi:hypothetical protein